MSSLIVLTILSGLLAISEALPFCKKHNFNGQKKYGRGGSRRRRNLTIIFDFLCIDIFVFLKIFLFKKTY